MRQIKNEQDWLDALDECGPFNTRRLRWLVHVAETRGWPDLSIYLRYEMAVAEALYQDAALSAWEQRRRRNPLGVLRGVFACK